MRRNWWISCMVLAGMLLVAPVMWAVTIEELPPSVVQTTPQSGDATVAPGATEITVTFSKDMMDQSWSFVQLSETSFPKILEGPEYKDDKRTCVIKVELAPNQTYAIWLNSDRFQNFKDAARRPAVPYLLVFKTGDEDS